MRRTVRTRPLAGLVLMPILSSAIFAGCGGAGDGLERESVVGSVKWEGGPMKSGLIQFQPSSPGVSTASAGSIDAGSYSIGKLDGLVPGTYRVSITSASAQTQTVGAMPGDSLPPPKEPIPSKYNSQTQLTAEVKKGGPNQFEFDLKSR